MPVFLIILQPDYGTAMAFLIATALMLFVAGMDKKYIAEQLDDVIYNLPENSSSELFNILYRIQDNLLFGNEF